MSRKPGGKVLVALFLCLSGCATWSKHGISARPPAKIRLAVLPTQIGVTIKRLRDIETMSKSAEAIPNEKELVRDQIREVAGAITSDLATDLSASYFFEVVADSEVQKALATGNIDLSSRTISIEQTKSLGKALGAQALLFTEVSGYGKIKSRWLAYLIGSGLLEGLVQGVVVASVISNPWVAVGVGTEEAAQESAEWGGGVFLFDRIYSPVVLEGKMFSVSDGKTIWSGTSLASSNRKDVRKLPEADRSKKEIRLRLTARKTAKNLVNKIDREAWANLKNAPIE